MGKPAKLIVKQIADQNGIITAQVEILDDRGISCLDSVSWINFGLTSDGELLDDLGTPDGSRKVQANNGRAMIKVKTANGKSILSVKSPGLSTVFLNLAGK